MSDTLTYSRANASSASRLVDSFGINTQASFDSWNAYDNSSLILRSLNYLKIDSVRESIRTTGVPGEVLSAMADAGIKFDVIAPNSIARTGVAGVQAYVDQIAAFAVKYPGAVTTIEGQNEVNVYGTDFGGDTSLASAVTVQKLLYGAVKANDVLSGVGVINLTLANNDLDAYRAIGDLSAYSDYANAHVYTGPASNIGARDAYTIDLARAASSGNQLIITETGLPTLAGSNLSVDEAAQAKMVLGKMLSGYANGSVKTYIYSLFDTPGSETRETNNYFGLFRADGSAKPAADAVHNLTTLLDADQGQPMVGSMQVSGLGADGRSLNLTKTSGATDLVLWRDVTAWDPRTGAAATVSPDPVTITFSEVQARVYVYSPTDSLNPLASYENVSSITLPLADSPLIIELGTSHPLTLTAAAAPSASMAFDEAQFVARIDALSQMTGLTEITLTGDHVLSLASADTLRDVLAHYGDVLAKIQGDYQFMIDKTGAGWKTESLYDEAGKLVSTATITEFVPGERKVHVDVAAGGTSDVWWVDGVLRREQKLTADGVATSAVYDQVGQRLNDTEVTPTGTTTYRAYDAATGALSLKAVVNADKSGDTWRYGITGESYTSDHVTKAAGGEMVSTERFYANGKLAYSSELQDDGSRVIDTFSIKGLKTQEVVVAADGGRATVTFAYDSANHLTSRTETSATGVWTNVTYDAAGAVKTKAVVNADKSGDTWHHGITGESYTSDHIVRAAGGSIASVTRFHADRTLDYRATYLGDVAKVVETFDAEGDRLQTVRTAADGTRSFHDYVEASDQATVKTNLYKYTSTSGGKLTLAGAPTVNVVDADGHVLHALDAGAFKIVNGTLTLDTSRVTDVLHVGERAYVDVTYIVTNGSKASPTSFFSVEIDGTLKLEAGTAAADQIDRGAAAGRFHLDGRGGNDQLTGGAGGDVIDGGAGDDLLRGNGGDDLLRGGTGTNSYVGGLGADRFDIAADARDTITDFSAAQGDVIDLSHIDAVRGNAPGSIDHFTLLAGTAFTGKAGELIVREDSAFDDGAHWLVLGDTDGEGHADFVLHVTAQTAAALTAHDFILA